MIFMMNISINQKLEIAAASDATLRNCPKATCHISRLFLRSGLAVEIADQYYMESDTYVLAGVRYFTVNVDCGTPAFFVPAGKHPVPYRQIEGM